MKASQLTSSVAKITRVILERLTSSWLYLPLTRLKYWIQLTVAKKALQLSRVCLALSAAEVRLLDPAFKQVGEDEVQDRIVSYVVRTILKIDATPDDALDDEQLALARNLVERAQTSEPSKEVAATYWLSRAYLDSAANKHETAEQRIALARLFDPSSQMLDADATYARYKSVSKRLHSVQRTLAERGAFKLDVSGNDLITLLAVVSPLFLVTGYFYSRTLLGAFGIDVSLFFSVGDYLASSIENLRYAVVSTSVGVVALIAGLHSGSLRSRQSIKLGAQKAQRQERWILVLTILAAIKVAWDFYHGTPSYSQLHIVSIFLGLFLADWISARFFRNRLLAFVALSSIFAFATYSIVDVQQKIHDLRSRNWQGRDRLRISRVEGYQLDVCDLVVFAANAEYYFALSKSRLEAYVLPRSAVTFFPIATKTT